MTFRRHHHQQPTEEAPVVKKEAEENIEPAQDLADLPKVSTLAEVDTIPEPVQDLTEKKKRTDTKEVLNVGIVGDTIEVKDFRAIVKKAGKQINVVLTEILSEWNQKNYNL